MPTPTEFKSLTDSIIFNNALATKLSTSAKTSQAEAEAGADNVKYMTALRTAQAIAELAESGGGSDLGILDVREWGAVCDNTTDDTSAVQAAVEDAAEMPIATLFFPGTAKTTSEIVIPALNQAAGNLWRTLRFKGPGHPQTLFGTIGSFNSDEYPSGASIRSEASSGAAIRQAAGSGFAGFSLRHISFEDFWVKLFDNPTIDAIDVSLASQMSARNLKACTGIYSALVSEPTHNKAGLITPNIDNGGLTFLQNLDIGGFTYGIVVNEHTEGHQINVTSNKYGLYFNAANHASFFSRVDAQRNRYNIVCGGAAKFDIAQLNIEHATDDSYFETVADILDDTQTSPGTINYNVRQSDGNPGVWIPGAGSSIVVKQIGNSLPKAGIFATVNNQTMTSGSAGLIGWEAGSVNSDQTNWIVGTPGEIPFVSKGRYRLDFSITFASNASNYREVIIYKNGSPIISYPVNAISGRTTIIAGALPALNMAAGDILSIKGFQNSGGDLQVIPTSVLFVTQVGTY